MRASHFSPDTWELIGLFHANGAQYVIVGGEAVIHYGHARLTGDVDFFYGTEPENVARLHSALLTFWDGDIPGVQDAKDLSVPDQVLQFGRPPNRIDLLTQISGVSFAEAWASRETVVADDGTPVLLISRALLLRNKEASARPKDLDDAAFLRAGIQRSSEEEA